MSDDTTQKFRSFALTARPRDGITDEQVTKFVKWCKKHCDYYHICTEKLAEQRHLHSGFFLKHPKSRSNLCALIKCLFKDLDETEKKVLIRGLRIMYNPDFIQEYLDKDDDTMVIESCLPEQSHMETYFPLKPEEKDKTRKCSAYYHMLEKLWYEKREPHTEVRTEVVRSFLFKCMYADRCIPVIRDDKQIIQVARHLTRWLNKASHSTIDLPPFEREE